MPIQEQEYVATRVFRAGGEDFVQDFERGEVVPLDKIIDGWILKDTGDVVLSNSDEGLQAIADRERNLKLAEEQRAQVSAAEPKPEEEPDATSAAERKAEELGVDLASVEGTGKDGRVTAGDVERAAEDQG